MGWFRVTSFTCTARSLVPSISDKILIQSVDPDQAVAKVIGNTV